MNQDVKIEVKKIKNIFSTLYSRKNIEDENNNNEFISKIRVQNFLSINEIKICDVIRTIPYYQNRYNILYIYEPINIGQFNGKILEKLETTHNTNINTKYLIFQYKKSDYTLFHEFLFQIKTPKSLIFFVTETYSFLLNSLIELYNNGICFLDLSYKNIVLSVEYREKPILVRFQNCLKTTSLDEHSISKIIEGVNDYTYKPLELYVLFYLINNELNTISYSLIEEVCEFYITSLTVLKIFSLEYQTNFKNLCINSLKKYLNQPKIIIVNDILKHHSTWPNYSLSLLYLHIVGNMLRVFSFKNTFINQFVIILSKNIRPDPTERESLMGTLEKYEKLYYAFNDWSFVNNISAEKMELLLKILAE
jgi:hypothetical protein